MRILSWNVNGIRAAYRKGFAEWFAREAPDVLCLQETKASPSQLAPELLSVEGYHSYFNAAERPGYSGVATYSRVQPREVTAGLGIEKFDSEGRVLRLDYGDFLLFNIYFPNGKSSAQRLEYKMEFYDAFLEHVDGLRAAGRHIIVCGDVNTAHREIDIARPKANENISGFLPLERAWMDRWVSHGYVDTFRRFNQEPGQYTWWDARGGARARNVGWRIDYFFVDQGLEDRVTSAFIMPDVMGSDHCPIGIEISREG
jgi:exodeoxyribonuclease III